METDQQGEPVEEIDETLIEWFLQLSVVERLEQERSPLERLRRAASTDR